MASVAILAVSLVAGCDQPEATPAGPEQQQAALTKRVEMFGEAARGPDIQWRGSGLGLRVLEAGTGRAPGIADTVRVHYVGRLKDGTVFDSSRARGRPNDFAVGRVVTGLAAALATLKPGGRGEFFIPPSLGYGSQKQGMIPPNSGLIFEVELIAVNPAESPK